MGTSCSNDAGWTAGAYLFSGRPDPVWPVDAISAARLIDIWHMLVPAHGARGAKASPLAYRGCYLSNGSGERWIACDACAQLERAGTTQDTRVDAGRSFELAILATAPSGTLPASLAGVLTTEAGH